MKFRKKGSIASHAIAAMALAAALTPPSSFANPGYRTPTVDDAYLSIEDLQRAYAMGELTPTDMTRLFQQRIESIDRSGPTLNSVLEINPDAIAAATAAEAAYRGGRSTALTGIPILLKDSIDTGDRMRTTAGSLALERPANRDATIVTKLRNAGAIILGKANLSEWSNFRGWPSINGWSARGGFTLHPYVLDRDPIGSSTGSGAAVAAGLATASIGLETAGSIVSPALAMGLVGIKPTVGLVSRAGTVPVSRTQDTVGPMARSVADAAAVLTVIAGTDLADPVTADADSHASDYTQYVDAGRVKGMRIGLVRHQDGTLDPGTEKAMRILENSGAVIVDAVTLPPTDTARNDHLPMLLTEFKQDIAAYLATRDEPSLRSLDDLIAFNEREAEHEMQYFGQEMFLWASQMGTPDDPQHRLRRENALRTTGPEGIDATLAAHKLDALIGPMPVVEIAALAGYPVMTLPTHFEGELPEGVLIFGTKWSEPTLISIASAVEAEAKAFRRPKYLPTLPVR
ncbi:amidase family protein [Luteibacter sp. SG786]|uniref:amidase family protein n=1 Tax=Luteibacter sp. SG786 TaxID=2587130 RepID=UPI001423EA32|nr:amidase family protein [Luteibacter sp. SG786]NII54712.1 amidase [Luteibacter sp. SG786]